MALPTAYDEFGLALYMETALGKVAAALGLSVPDDYQEAVNDTLAAYGVTDIAKATDIAKLRALARREAWRMAATAAAAYTSYQADGASFSLSDLLKNVQVRLSMAESEAMPYESSGGYRVTRQTITHTDAYSDEEDTA